MRIQLGLYNPESRLSTNRLRFLVPGAKKKKAKKPFEPSLHQKMFGKSFQTKEFGNLRKILALPRPVPEKA
jgi:hypothetical protein